MRLREIFRDYSHDKLSRDNAVSAVRTDVIEKLCKSEIAMDINIISDVFNKICKGVFRSLILEDSIRLVLNFSN
jgi:polyribonucleotide nucleotidyltransferase